MIIQETLCLDDGAPIAIGQYVNDVYVVTELVNDSARRPIVITAPTKELALKVFIAQF